MGLSRQDTHLENIERLLGEIVESGGGGGGGGEPGSGPMNKKAVVDELPTENISTSTIYIVPSESPEEGNVKDEWINLTGKPDGWEKLGGDDDAPVSQEEFDDMISKLHSL